jgi:hypothetical protein
MGYLEHVPDVDQKRAGHRRHVHPLLTTTGAVVAPDLQPADSVLRQQRPSLSHCNLWNLNPFVKPLSSSLIAFPMAKQHDAHKPTHKEIFL